MIEPMEMEFELPMVVPTADGFIHVADYTVKASIEWDETMSGADWYVASVSVLGCLPGKPDRWHELSDEHDITRGVKKRAYDEWHAAIQRKWEDHIMDLPRKRRGALRLVQ